MPSKKKKYNARFPAGRIKKIMQSDEEIGKVAQAVPVIISRTLELFVESLLTKTLKVTNSRNAKTLSPSHMKQCIMSESRFDFLRELVKNIPDISVAEEGGTDSPPDTPYEQDMPFDLSKPSTSYGSRDYPNVEQRTMHNTPQPAQESSENRAELKRQWENVNRIRKQFEGNSIANIAHLHQTDTSSTPPKLHRTDSAPTASSSYSTQYISKSAKETNALQSKSSRRLQHQPKSVPCSSQESSSSSPQDLSTTAKIPAPVISIDFCNKPVVKIDYSNLALHDTNYSDGINNQQFLNHSKETTNLIKSTSDSDAMNPVINIDLSNICANFTNPNPTETPTNPFASGAFMPTSKSSLELDEDYDNI